MSWTNTCDIEVLAKFVGSKPAFSRRAVRKIGFVSPSLLDDRALSFAALPFRRFAKTHAGAAAVLVDELRPPNRLSQSNSKNWLRFANRGVRAAAQSICGSCPWPLCVTVHRGLRRSRPRTPTAPIANFFGTHDLWRNADLQGLRKISVDWLAGNRGRAAARSPRISARSGLCQGHVPPERRPRFSNGHSKSPEIPNNFERG